LILTGTLCIRVNPSAIHYINRIMEGYEYLGTVSTVKREEGIVIIRGTPDTESDIREILAHLDIPYEYVLPCR